MIKSNTITMKTKLFFSSVFLVSAHLLSAQVWNQKADLTAVSRSHAVGFSIGNKGYIGTGYGGGMNRTDFWEWDQPTNTWTQRADFGGLGRYGAVGLSIGKKGYIGTGKRSVGASNISLDDLWEWDGDPASPTFNTWTSKTTFGGTPRSFATSFSMGNKGYIVTGSNDVSYYNDLWEYNLLSDSWTQKAPLPAIGRVHAVGFSIGAKGYIGTGNNQATCYKDFWEWDQATNQWTQKTDFPGGERFSAIGFSIGNNGFVGTGADKTGIAQSDFWEYNPATDSWIQRTDYDGGVIRGAIGFSIGTKGYIQGGSPVASKASSTTQFWEYGDTTAATPPCFITVSAFADPVTICKGNTIAIYAAGGKTYLWNTGSTAYNITDVPTVTTTYTVTGTSTSGCTGTATITITVQDCATGINEINLSASALVSPNPFSESATVIITGVEGTYPHELKIFDMLGNEVRSISFTGSQTTLERGNLVDGVYFYKIQTPLSLGRGLPAGQAGAGGEVGKAGKFIISKL